MEPKLGLYVHVPLCRGGKCRYCDFYSLPFTAPRARRYISALAREAELRARDPRIRGRRFHTLYLGGGTPTSLGAGALAGLLEMLSRTFPLEPGAEVTVEANPGTVDREGLARLRAAGASRLSLGVQAFQDRLLSSLGRRHRARDAGPAVLWAREAGFCSVGVDLMFGLPGQTLADWRESLDRALELGPDHLSTYSLLLEPGTRLEADVRSGRARLPDPDLEADMFEAAMDLLPAAGFEHYEVSNFARPGYRCRHNLLYWEGGEYLGLGPGAHSFLGGERSFNLPDLEGYAREVERGRLPTGGSLRPEPEELMGEAMFLGLRLVQGVSLAGFSARFGVAVAQAFPGSLEKLQRLGLLVLDGDRVRLSRRGLMLGNAAFGEFLRAPDHAAAGASRP
ncbi:MAG: radical SAM family heme chaperone HemW [Acetobacteraceae bacterium]|nr:radical SAM family heme chaperone HemW [Acetobacteraceae bacterium]